MPRDSSLTQKAYVRLREDLLACRLPPGERLNIKVLSQALSVSLGAVREALSRLTSEGFVVTDARRGFRAAPISIEDLRDLTNVRFMIEGMCLKQAMAAGDVNWESNLLAAHHRLSRTPQRAPEDPQRLNYDYAAAHEAFHRALVSACDSSWLLRLRELLYAQSERYRYLTVPLARKKRNIEREHEEILKAALARDQAKAMALLGEHLETTTRLLIDAEIMLENGGHIGGGAPAPSRKKHARGRKVSASPPSRFGGAAKRLAADTV